MPPYFDSIFPPAQSATPQPFRECEKSSSNKIDPEGTSVEEVRPVLPPQELNINVESNKNVKMAGEGVFNPVKKYYTFSGFMVRHFLSINAPPFPSAVHPAPHQLPALNSQRLFQFPRFADTTAPDESKLQLLPDL